MHDHLNVKFVDGFLELKPVYGEGAEAVVWQTDYELVTS